MTPALITTPKSDSPHEMDPKAPLGLNPQVINYLSKAGRCNKSFFSWDAKLTSVTKKVQAVACLGRRARPTLKLTLLRRDCGN